MQVHTPLTIALAITLVGALAGGMAIADTTPDELPADHDREVLDPDDQLDEDAVDAAIDLALDNDTVAEATDAADDPAVTVQAHGDQTDVVVMLQDGADAVVATVDPYDERVTQVADVTLTDGAEAFTQANVAELHQLEGEPPINYGPPTLTTSPDVLDLDSDTVAVHTPEADGPVATIRPGSTMTVTTPPDEAFATTQRAPVEFDVTIDGDTAVNETFEFETEDDE